jgi:hypothetical protein
MNTTSLRLAGLVMMGALGLTACGGGGGGDAAPTAAATSVPDSALATSDALVTYQSTMVSTSSDTSEPLTVPDTAMPTSDTTEPTPLS